MPSYSQHCVYKGCKNLLRDQKIIKNLRFHRFPSGKRWEEWERLCGRAGRIKIQSPVICSLHFKKRFYSNNDKVNGRLQPDAVPKDYQMKRASEIPVLRDEKYDIQTEHRISDALFRPSESGMTSLSPDLHLKFLGKSKSRRSWKMMKPCHSKSSTINDEPSQKRQKMEQQRVSKTIIQNLPGNPQKCCNSEKENITTQSRPVERKKVVDELKLIPPNYFSTKKNNSVDKEKKMALEDDEENFLLFEMMNDELEIPIEEIEELETLCELKKTREEEKKSTNDYEKKIFDAQEQTRKAKEAMKILQVENDKLNRELNKSKSIAEELKNEIDSLRENENRMIIREKKLHSKIILLKDKNRNLQTIYETRIKLKSDQLILREKELREKIKFIDEMKEEVETSFNRRQSILEESKKTQIEGLNAIRRQSVLEENEKNQDEGLNAIRRQSVLEENEKNQDEGLNAIRRQSVLEENEKNQDEGLNAIRRQSVLEENEKNQDEGLNAIRRQSVLEENEKNQDEGLNAIRRQSILEENEKNQDEGLNAIRRQSVLEENEKNQDEELNAIRRQSVLEENEKNQDEGLNAIRRQSVLEENEKNQDEGLNAIRRQSILEESKKTQIEGLNAIRRQSVLEENEKNQDEGLNAIRRQSVLEENEKNQDEGLNAIRRQSVLEENEKNQDEELNTIRHSKFQEFRDAFKALGERLTKSAAKGSSP